MAIASFVAGLGLLAFPYIVSLVQVFLLLITFGITDKRFI